MTRKSQIINPHTYVCLPALVLIHKNYEACKCNKIQWKMYEIK